ncbi:MAG: flagellar motor protein MotB [Planctomycetota bacterium]
MGKKHKHEEHVNHERWVISYADMVTLLFALFVVLYALGEVQLRKLKELKKSIQFAFHFEGSGKTKDEGIFEKGESGGALVDPAPLLTAQKKEMEEFLLETLPREFEERTGKSLEIVQTDDTVAFTGPLSAYFPRGQVYLRPTVNAWLQDLVKGAYSFTSRIRVRIEAPNVRIGTAKNGTAILTNSLCVSRLGTLQNFLLLSVLDEDVILEFRYVEESRLARPGPNGWEDQAVVIFAFTNMPDDITGKPRPR